MNCCFCVPLSSLSIVVADNMDTLPVETAATNSTYRKRGSKSMAVMRSNSFVSQLLLSLASSRDKRSRNGAGRFTAN